MKIKFRNCLIIILLLLVVISCGLAFKFMSKSAGAQTVEDTEEFDYSRRFLKARYSFCSEADVSGKIRRSSFP